MEDSRSVQQPSSELLYPEIILTTVVLAWDPFARLHLHVHRRTLCPLPLQ